MHEDAVHFHLQIVNGECLNLTQRLLCPPFEASSGGFDINIVSAVVLHEMASDRIPLSESSMTIPSDSEQYSGNDELSPSPPPSSSNSPMILYSPPTLWGLLRGAAINLLLPFINGLMLGFGELFAHEAAFRLGWGGVKVRWISSCRKPDYNRSSSYGCQSLRLRQNGV
jgi:Outer membrane protein TOM13